MVQFITAQEAAQLVKDGDTLASPSFGLSNLPEAIMNALKERYDEEKHPAGISYIHGPGIGNNTPGRGLDYFVADGMAKRIYSGHMANSPLMNEKVIDNQIECYLLPQGVVTHLYRAIASHKPGVITKVGLNTYVDPRVEGAAANPMTDKEGYVKLLKDDQEEEWLLYPSFPINVAMIRGTYADERGNISWEQEVAKFEDLSIAQAAKNSGGIVIAQVKGKVKSGSMDPKTVKVPGAFVDYVVVVEDNTLHQQTSSTEYNPAFSNEIQVPESDSQPLPLTARKIIQRRAAMELVPNSVGNLGIGVPVGVSDVAAEEGVSDDLTLTVEAGIIGGNALGGLNFGVSTNAQAIIAHGEMFDFYDGGGLDLTVLGLAECDQYGNINVSKFGGRVTGPGGFINLTSGTKNVVFAGTFTAGGKSEIKDGKLHITKQGKAKKFVADVEQITFSGKQAEINGQNILYITERAVFDLHDGQLRLREVAPGVDIETDILEWMDFKPLIPDDVKEMNPDIFQEEWGGLKEIINNK
ncbi:MULTISPECIES: acyl CoA:acetate/3-ketoacid CoA transferase [Aerococcus]|uniref:acyl CoA:acetate/3-ketoacid CoA transferase n=1 Tax=Aerococcus TaxID=1375 RepID=UPI000DCCA7A0|nr:MULTISPECIES: CoA-transferase [Aerococcus]KAA9234140.1 acyl CoA:acetate/3-ketoacid CoA transferase [Aerococcus mictus]MDK6375241.1 CoA-transferase [Aerococcus urinae]MDK6420089.1 CoA-transferase [Aerococcus urinae]MDK8075582.1 CoA-transferase [Aerococcus urinae]MDK8084649.1 CoA-transferase [Aerococcus urinae]